MTESVLKLLNANMDAFFDMGTRAHNRATYGDEQSYMTPGELIKEPEARTALEKARRALALAQEIFELRNPPRQDSGNKN